MPPTCGIGRWRRRRSTLAVELVDADGAVVARTEAPVTTFPGDTITARTRLHVADARRWSLDDPYLYTCRAMLLDDDDVVDEESTTFGIRIARRRSRTRAADQR